MRPRLDDAKRAKIVKLREQKLTYADICERLDVGHSTVSRVIDEAKKAKAKGVQ